MSNEPPIFEEMRAQIETFGDRVDAFWGWWFQVSVMGRFLMLAAIAVLLAVVIGVVVARDDRNVAQWAERRQSSDR